MNNQWKRITIAMGFGAIFALIACDAFALGRGHSSSYRGWQQHGGSDNAGNDETIVENGAPVDNGGSVEITPPTTGDANPVPEPASLVLFGSALAGLGGYRGLRKRLARRKGH